MMIIVPAPLAFAGDAPMVENLAVTLHPATPRDLKLTCLVAPDTLALSTTCPVIKWRGRSYWPYSYVDNRIAIALVEYDATGRPIEQLVLPGVRYPWKVTQDVTGQVLTIWGQGSASATVAWEELEEAQLPVVMNVLPSSAPSRPSDLKVTCNVNGSSLADATYCPVVYWGGYAYWAFSHTDNRTGMAIVAYGPSGNQVMRWNRNGARYVWNITVAGDVVTFLGQANGRVIMTLSDMRSSGP